jgi:hypothetical protein
MRRAQQIGLALAASLLSVATGSRAEPAPAGAPVRFALVGASIGQGWDLPAFPERMHLEGIRFEYVGVFDFDKTLAVRDLLARPTQRPEVLVLKECASYFPGDLAHYQTLLRGWIAAARNAGVLPVPATVAPVVAPHGRWERLRRFVRTRLLGRPDRSQQIRAFNEWLRQLAAEEGLPLLDLEAALRVSDTDRSLRPDLTSGDGLHLNAKGYALLDAALAALVSRDR